ncbi:hypothetical protein UP10_36620 [Bradyrhizobium sp. LTSPM299]|nr:hypothetical protein UP10_36620 [Bradyrhizobium sp. LTSPM299]
MDALTRTYEACPALRPSLLIDCDAGTQEIAKAHADFKAKSEGAQERLAVLASRLCERERYSESGLGVVALDLVALVHVEDVRKTTVSPSRGCRIGSLAASQDRGFPAFARLADDPTYGQSGSRADGAHGAAYGVQHEKLRGTRDGFGQVLETDRERVFRELLCDFHPVTSSKRGARTLRM